jgi:hypothetical protein
VNGAAVLRFTQKIKGAHEITPKILEKSICGEKLMGLSLLQDGI